MKKYRFTQLVTYSTGKIELIDLVDKGKVVRSDIANPNTTEERFKIMQDHAEWLKDNYPGEIRMNLTQAR
jgi:DNA polymerase sigma